MNLQTCHSSQLFTKIPWKQVSYVSTTPSVPLLISSLSTFLLSSFFFLLLLSNFPSSHCLTSTRGGDPGDYYAGFSHRNPGWLLPSPSTLLPLSVRLGSHYLCLFLQSPHLLPSSFSLPLLSLFSSFI